MEVSIFEPQRQHAVKAHELLGQEPDRLAAGLLEPLGGRTRQILELREMPLELVHVQSAGPDQVRPEPATEQDQPPRGVIEDRRGDLARFPEELAERGLELHRADSIGRSTGWA